MNPQEQIKVQQDKIRMIETRLTDVEKGKIFAFNQDKGMQEAVRKVLMYNLYMMGDIHKNDATPSDVNWAFVAANVTVTDEQIGKEIRIKSQALAYLNESFDQLSKIIKLKEVITEEKNKAI